MSSLLLLGLACATTAYPASSRRHTKGELWSVCAQIVAPQGQPLRGQRARVELAPDDVITTASFLLPAEADYRIMLADEGSKSYASAISEALIKDDATAGAAAIAEATTAGDVGSVASALAVALAQGMGWGRAA